VYAHPAVRWVYKTGGQIGMDFVVVWPIDNYVHDVFPGNGCVVVKEGPFGCMQTGPWRPEYALDLETGALTFGEPTARDFSYLGTSWSQTDKVWHGRIDERAAILLVDDCRELRIGRPDAERESYVAILRIPEGESLGRSLNFVRPEKGLLVIGMWGGYVICIDLTKVPEISGGTTSRPAALAAAPRQSAAGKSP
jgi:hypothetical protein